ncbi:MAG: carboxypeptidase regulatory-like domain-containing protein [Fimbriiglobus sp.]
MKLLLALCAAIALAAFSFAEPPQQTVIIEVYRDGKLADDAEIYSLDLIKSQSPGNAYEATQAKLVGKGRRLETPLASAFLARDSRGNIGGFRAHLLNDWPTIRIDLLETETMPGRLVDSDGKPVAGMKLDAWNWSPPPANEKDGVDINRYLALSGMNWTCTTDAAGRFTSPAFPKGYTLSLRHQFTDGTKMQFDLSNKRTEFVVPKFGQLRLIVETDGEPVALEKCVCSIFPKQRAEVYQPEYEVPWNAKGESGPRLGGEYEIHLQLPDNSDRLLVESKVTVSIKPSQATEVRFKTKKGSILTGKIVDKKTGQGIPGLKVYAYEVKDRDREGSSTTDASGRYRMAMAESGQYTVRLDSYNSSDGRFFASPSFREPKDPVVVPKLGQAEYPTISLEEGLTFRAKIVDKDQKPIHGPFELEFSRTGLPYYPEDKDVFTVQGNLVTIRGLSPRGSSLVQIRQGKAVNEKVLFLPSDLHEEHTIVLDESFSGTGAGKVTDIKGQPVAGVMIHLKAFVPYDEVSHYGKTIRRTRTDAKGEYRFENLSKAFPHVPVLSDPRFPGSKPVTPKNIVPGRTLVFDDFQVKVFGMTISGQVLGLDGKPVVGATVQSCGETPKTERTITDANGRYRLENLPDGRAFVTANKKGFRYTYALVGGEEDPVNLTLRKLDEAPAPLPDAKAFAAEKKKILRSMLQMTWEAAPEGSAARLQIFRAAVKSHPDLAESWVKAAQGKTQEAYTKALEPQPTMAELLELGLKKPEAAIEKMRLAELRWDSFKEVAEKVILQDKAKALLITKAGVLLLRDRQAGNPEGLALGLSQFGALMIRSGAVREGKAHLEEAEKLLDSIEPRWRNRIRSEVIPYFAEIDVSLAIEKMKLLPDVTLRNAAACHILGIIARTDAKQAIEKLDLLIKPDHSLFHIEDRISIAQVIVDTQPDLAIKLIDEDPNPIGQLRGYIKLAYWLKKKDILKSHKLIERAMTVIDQARDRSSGGFYVGAKAHAAAHLAYLAHALEYPDCHSMIARALINRELTQDFERAPRFNRPVAFNLGAVDPEAGRWLFEMDHPNDSIAQLRDRASLYVLAFTDPFQYSVWLTKQMGKPYNLGTWSDLGILNTLTALADPAEEFFLLGKEDYLSFGARPR